LFVVSIIDNVFNCLLFSTSFFSVRLHLVLNLGFLYGAEEMEGGGGEGKLRGGKGGRPKNVYMYYYGVYRQIKKIC